MREIKYQTFYGGAMHRWGIFQKNDSTWEFIPPVDLLTPQRQFTGLKDKNGKEIYEGDILRYTAKNKVIPNPLSVVDWGVSRTGFWLTVVGKTEAIRLTGALLENKDSGGFYEIMGNIYENPELLGKAAA